MKPNTRVNVYTIPIATLLTDVMVTCGVLTLNTETLQSPIIYISLAS